MDSRSARLRGSLELLLAAARTGWGGSGVLAGVGRGVARLWEASLAGDSTWRGQAGPSVASAPAEHDIRPVW